jgi:hypothetical protein
VFEFDFGFDIEFGLVIEFDFEFYYIWGDYSETGIEFLAAQNNPPKYNRIQNQTQ